MRDFIIRILTLWNKPHMWAAKRKHQVGPIPEATHDAPNGVIQADLELTDERISTLEVEAEVNIDINSRRRQNLLRGK